MTGPTLQLTPTCTDVIGIPLSNVDYETATTRIIDWAQRYEHRTVCVCNVHSTTSSRWNPTLRRALLKADMNTADGMPLVWMLRKLGAPDSSRVYGPNLMLHLLEQANRESMRVALYGGHTKHMPALLNMIRKRFPNVNIVATVIPPYRQLTVDEDDAITKKLKDARPQITLVGIGCPKQEIWMHAHSPHIPGVMIGVGAAFDFHAGAVPQAPHRIQNMGLEWAYRLFCEPKRLLRRYLTTNPVFLCAAFKQLAQSKLYGYEFRKAQLEGQPNQNRKTSIGKSVAICVATYQRAELLKSLLQSLKGCHMPKNYRVELRIIDNDASGSARKYVDNFRAETSQFERITYTIEPRQNIACTRNLALNLGDADAYIFVDDDETVQPNWLVELIRCAERHQADAVFGPVVAKLDPAHSHWQARGGFFDKTVDPTGNAINWRATRTSNTLVRGEWFNQRGFRFDSALGRSGGSDTYLFARMFEHKAHYVSCREAVVQEYVPAQRAKLSWLWKRAYRNGLIYERNLKATSATNHPLLRAGKRLLAATALCARGLPKLLIGRPEDFIKGILKIPLFAGGLHAHIIPSSTTRHVAYPKNNDNAKQRVAFLTNIISPYRKPVFSSLAQMRDINLRIFVDAQTEFDRDWEMDTNDLPVEPTRSFHWKQTETSHGSTRFTQRLTKHVPYGLPYQLFRFKPNVVISLELGFRTAFAAAYCILTRTKLVIWSYQSRVSAKQTRLRKLWRSLLLKQATTVVGMGTQAHEVLRKWGVPESKIIDAPNAADHANYLRALNSDNANRQVATIRGLHAPKQKLAVVVGRLIPLKGIEHILTSWNALPKETKAQWKLVFIGCGPLEKLIAQQDSRYIEHVGNVPAKSMPYWYAAADLNIFPSCGDVWGLVVNEASICGTPTLCSKYAGCSDDLIRDGETGFTIDFSLDAEASQNLQAVLKRKDLKRVGRAARQVISSYSPKAMANSFKQAISISCS
ncbi:MAG: WecB/TagA/CpsF family glycosyltransferase [Coraliomargarita sp.]